MGVDDEEGWRLERVLEGMSVKVLEHWAAYDSAARDVAKKDQLPANRVWVDLLHDARDERVARPSKFPTLGKALPEQGKHPKPLYGRWFLPATPEWTTAAQVFYPSVSPGPDSFS